MKLAGSTNTGHVLSYDTIFIHLIQVILSLYSKTESPSSYHNCASRFCCLNAPCLLRGAYWVKEKQEKVGILV